MSQINIDEHFEKGTSGYEVTSQALSDINQARGTGDPRLIAEADRLEANLEASIINARKSNGKDVTGFNAVLKSIGGLTPQIQAIVTEKNKLQEKEQKTGEAVSELLANIKLTGGGGEDKKEGILMALNVNPDGTPKGPPDLAAVRILNQQFESERKASPEQTKGKPPAQKEELTPFEQRRVQDLAAMKLKSQGGFEDNEQFTQALVSKLSDPNEYGKLVTEAKKRDIIETQARKIFTRLQAARELYANSELMGEFGDTKPTEFGQWLVTSGDDALMKSLLGQLKGGDLAKAMEDMRTVAGTAAGMAQPETEALQNSISALKGDLSWEAAQKKLLQIINEGKYTLERLGVDTDLLKDKKTGDDIIANKVKYLLPDERSYHMGGSDTSMGKSGSGISSSDERLRSLTPQINKSPRTRIVPER